MQRVGSLAAVGCGGWEASHCTTRFCETRLVVKLIPTRGSQTTRTCHHPFQVAAKEHNSGETP